MLLVRTLLGSWPCVRLLVAAVLTGLCSPAVHILRVLQQEQGPGVHGREHLLLALMQNVGEMLQLSHLCHG